MNITILRTLVASVAMVAASALAAAPGMISHQGRVTVNGNAFNGGGQFRFALVNAAGDATYWSNDGNTPPTTAVSITVTRGIFSVNLGESMTAIPASVFANNDAVYLRTWFYDGSTSWQQITPDVRLTSVGYALCAETAATATTATTAGGVSGTVALANGGTGATTASGSLNNLLPAQNGRFRPRLGAETVVYALTADGSGTLFVGGSFPGVGAGTVNYVAK